MRSLKFKILTNLFMKYVIITSGIPRLKNLTFHLLLLFSFSSSLQMSVYAQNNQVRTPGPQGPVPWQQSENDKTNPAADNAESYMKHYTDGLIQKGTLEKSDTEFVITSEHISSTSGIHHIYIRQQLNGIQIYGADGDIHITSQGKSLQSHNSFIKSANSNVLGSAIPQLTAIEALNRASRSLGLGTAAAKVVSRSLNLEQSGVMTSSLSKSPIPFKLMYHIDENKTLRLSWDMSIESETTSNWWSVRVDATSGELLDTVDWTVECIKNDHDHVHDLSAGPSSNVKRPESAPTVSAALGNYEVFASPDESPQHGSTSRSIVANPDNGSVAGSPFGWHDTNGVPGSEFTITRGNNVYAYEDGDNPGYSPNGGANLNFTTSNTNGVNFSVNTNYSSGNQSEDAAITNLFYWSNIIHDMIYVYGMDEAAGNFQQINYTGAGQGNDYVRAEAQDGSGTCNANFQTPPDGIRPTMQMFICSNRDGDYDNGIIAHEYGHGISARLTGGAASVGCLFGEEQMGEGWSDYYGIVMTIQPEDVADQGQRRRGMGTFLFLQGPNGGGIRPQPYSTDIVNGNNMTYDTIKENIGVPHGVGSVWAEILWEVTWALINEHGWDPDYTNFSGNVNSDAGNVQSLALVTEGLKLQPCGPGFVTSRDAILQADQIIYGGANNCLLWDAFAKRGLGFSASQGSVNSRFDGVEAFDVPSTSSGTLDFNDNEFCLASGVVTIDGGGVNEGTFSGPGVTDDGNGTTFTFDPVEAGVGEHIIEYDGTDCNGASSTLTEIITVTEDFPELSTCAAVTITLGADGTATYNPFEPNSVVIVGGNNSGNTLGQEGFSVLVVDIIEDVTVSFDWDFVNSDDEQNFDNAGYVVGNTFFPITEDGGGLNQSGSQTVTLQAGDVFGFAVSTDDNAFGAATTTFTNFSSGYTGQFDPFNWEEILQNSDGSASFQGSSISLLQSCGENTITVSQDTFTCEDVSSSPIPVTVTVTDSLGNSDTCITNVTVDQGDFMGDLQPVCQNITVALGANGVASIVASDIDNGSSFCGEQNPNISIDVNSFTCDNIGENSVTLTVSDGNGASAACVAIVTVVDTILPTVNCGNFTVQLDENGIASINVQDININSFDNCGVASRTLDITSFNCDNLGENTVALTVTDNNGNITTCTATVTVEDTIPAVITGPDSFTQITSDTDTSCETVVTYNPVTATDNCSQNEITIVQTAGLGSGQSFPVGTTTETYEIIELNGNVTTYSFDVTVTDGANPIITNCPEDIVESVNSGESFVVPDFSTTVTLTDNCTDSPIYTQTPNAGELILAGESIPVIISATDEAGNVTSCSFNLTVDETLGLENTTLENDVLIYPNPTSKDITISYSGNQQLVSVKVVDLNGKIVRLHKFDSGFQNTINLSNLSSGMYFLQISSQTESLIKKLIKN